MIPVAINPTTILIVTFKQTSFANDAAKLSSSSFWICCGTKTGYCGYCEDPWACGIFLGEFKGETG